MIQRRFDVLNVVKNEMFFTDISVWYMPELSEFSKANTNSKNPLSYEILS